MWQCAPPPTARCTNAGRRCCRRTAAALCRRTVSKRRSYNCVVSASALSFTSHSLTIGPAHLPASNFWDGNQNIVHALPALQHVFNSGGGGSAAAATSQLTAAVRPPVQPSLVERVASTCQHVVHPAIGVAHMTVAATGTGWRQLVHFMTARRGSFANASMLALGGAVLLLLALKLWRHLSKGHRQKAQAAQREAAAAQLASQRQRILLALDEYVEDVPAAPLMQSFQAILEDYESLLDNSVPTLDVNGLPLGEAMVNPVYSHPDSQEVQQQWADFVAGAKLTAVRPDAWWDIRDIEEQPAVLADDIDWNA